MTTFLILASSFALILSIGNSVLIFSLEQEAKKRDKFKRNVDTLYEKYTVWHPDGIYPCHPCLRG